MENNGYKKYLNAVEENKFGNSILFNYKNKQFSHSLLNSLLEINTIHKYINFDENRSILEIGAGSGRICSALLQIEKNLKYTIADIPPTLYVAQTNLSNVFKEKKIFKYRKFNSFKEIENQLFDNYVLLSIDEAGDIISNFDFQINVIYANKDLIDKFK